MSNSYIWFTSDLDLWPLTLMTSTRNWQVPWPPVRTVNKWKKFDHLQSTINHILMLDERILSFPQTSRLYCDLDLGLWLWCDLKLWLFTMTLKYNLDLWPRLVTLICDLDLWPWLLVTISYDFGWTLEYWSSTGSIKSAQYPKYTNMTLETVLFPGCRFTKGAPFSVQSIPV